MSKFTDKHYTDSECNPVYVSFQGPAVPLLIKSEPGLVQFGCSLCGAVFTYKSSVYHHIKAKHSGERTKCPFCDYSTEWKKNMKGHIENVHKVIV